MNQLKKIGMKMAVSCAGLMLIWQAISMLPPVKNIHLPGNSGLSIDHILETFFLTLIAWVVWSQSKNVAVELEAVFSKVTVLRLFWENLRLFVFLFLLYRAYVDFIPLLLGTGSSFFSLCFFLIMIFPIARIAWHGYRNLDLISDGDVWTRLIENIRQCGKCGGLNLTEAAYCRRCGAALITKPVQNVRCVCGAELPASDSFCSKCGRPPIPADSAVPPPAPPKTVNLTCPNCSANISPESRFCGKCGSKV